VDGGVPGYEALAREYTGEFEPCQLRDLGELRFVLRSVDKHAGWANVVLVVQSEGHVPSWLDRRSVRVVNHAEFIPQELLPTFHWATIAAHLHRIPSLSERYVYWEDDVLAGADLQPADLFGPDGQSTLNWATVPIFFGLGRFLGTYQLNLEETRRALGRLLGRKASAFLYPHAPLPVARRSWSAFHIAAMADGSFLGTITRRSRGDECASPTVDPVVLYANWVEAKVRGRTDVARYWRAFRGVVARVLPIAIRNGEKNLRAETYGVVNNDASMRRHMELLLRRGIRRPDKNMVVFHNVNDEAYDGWTQDSRRQDPSVLNPASVQLLQETLATLFPTPSRFERKGAGRN
jgi:hypothetical protein